MSRIRLLYIFSLAALPVLMPQLVEGKQRSPNFVVILCDNLGYGDIEPFGAEAIKTPSLNRMAREGCRFTDFYVTAGVCTPSRASLMTGCYAQRVGMHDNPRDGLVLRPLSPYGLNPSEITIAELLKAKEYATACIGKWHLGDQKEFLPTRQGFDSYFGIPYSDDMTRDTGLRLAERSPANKMDAKSWPPLPLMQDESVVEAPADRSLLTKKYTLKALEFIEENSGRPFFLYLSHAMPGSTSVPFASEGFRGKSSAGPWGDAVEEIDWSTGQILDKLQELGIDEKTLVIWTSDNGSPMARNESSPFRGSNGELHGRGYSTSEGAFRVPTIAWWPSRIEGGRVCSELATTMDLLPTFASLAGCEAVHEVDGHDMQGLLLDNSTNSSYEAFYYYQQAQLQAVRSGKWKLFLPLREFSRHPHFKKVAASGSKPLLFDLVADVSCRENVAENHPDVVARLSGLAETARQDLGDRNKLGKGNRTIGKTTQQPTPRVMD
ncbi:MAG: sulfatase [Planctomycetota bacterium]